MTITCPFVPDVIPVAVGAIVQSQTVAQFESTFTGNYRVPSAPFTFHWHGVLTDYIAGVPAVVAADQFAAMQAANLPIS